VRDLTDLLALHSCGRSHTDDQHRDADDRRADEVRGQDGDLLGL
jgi:hypothetical protein